VPALGFGAMGLTSYYGGIEKDDEVNRETIKLVSVDAASLSGSDHSRQAIQLGCTFIDTSDVSAFALAIRNT
jgi:aryl-alcohol dehydrogenase-like predicted oxidoreductase